MLYTSFSPQILGSLLFSSRVFSLESLGDACDGLKGSYHSWACGHCFCLIYDYILFRLILNNTEVTNIIFFGFSVLSQFPREIVLRAYVAEERSRGLLQHPEVAILRLGACKLSWKCHTRNDP